MNKLRIFDFDGTLVRTQTPEEGKLIWEEKTGVRWPHKGWWGRKESLDCEVFEHPLIESTQKAYIEERKIVGPIIMLTGRMGKLSKEVEYILEKYNLVFDEYRYNTGGDTFSNKVKQIGDILNKDKTIREISLYDDRFEHLRGFVNEFETLITLGKIDKYNLFHIDSNGVLHKLENK